METREQLLIKLSAVEALTSGLNAEDLRIRKEFAKAFGWFESTGFRDSISSPNAKSPTWSQIFIELGKLLANKDFREFEEEARQIQRNLFNLNEQVTKLNESK